MKKLYLAALLPFALAACQPSVQMVQQCGFNPQTGQQSCIMVPQGQTYYSYAQSPGYGYHDSGVGTAIVAGAAGYMIGQHMANSNNRSQPNYQQSAPSANNWGNNPQTPVAATSPAAPAFKPTAADKAPVGKTPTFGAATNQPISMAKVAPAQAPINMSKSAPISMAKSSSSSSSFKPMAASRHK